MKSHREDLYLWKVAQCSTYYIHCDITVIFAWLWLFFITHFCVKFISSLLLVNFDPFRLDLNIFGCREQPWLSYDFFQLGNFSQIFLNLLRTWAGLFACSTLSDQKTSVVSALRYNFPTEVFIAVNSSTFFLLNRFPNFKNFVLVFVI